jgi:hypothetical protein
MIAAGLTAFRLAGFTWTHAHEPPKPAFRQRRESLSTIFTTALMRHCMSPAPPRREVQSDIHEHHSASVSSRCVFAPRSGWPSLPFTSVAQLPRTTDRHFGDEHMFRRHRVFGLACFPSDPRTRPCLETIDKRGFGNPGLRRDLRNADVLGPMQPWRQARLHLDVTAELLLKLRRRGKRTT